MAVRAHDNVRGVLPNILLDFLLSLDTIILWLDRTLTDGKVALKPTTPSGNHMDIVSTVLQFTSTLTTIPNVSAG